MFRQSGYSRAISADIGEIERRLRALEQRLRRVGDRASASAAQTADRVGETIASALTSMAERFRGGAGTMGDEAAESAAGRPSSGTMPCAASPTRSSIARW